MARPRSYERLTLLVPPALIRFLDAASAMSGLPRDRLGGYLLLVGCAAQARSDGDQALADDLQTRAEAVFRTGDLAHT